MRWSLPSRVAGAVLLVSMPSLAVSQDEPPARADEARIVPHVTWSGPDSRVTQRGCFRARNEQQWLELWERHAGPARRDNINRPFIPRVNFDACEVVAIFEGDAHNSNGVFLCELVRAGDEWRLRYDEHTFQTAGPGGGAVAVRPFALFVLPKLDGPIVVEQNVQGLKDHPAKWKERARL
jgi:hypothetical protein